MMPKNLRVTDTRENQTKGKFLIIQSPYYFYKSNNVERKSTSSTDTHEKLCEKLNTKLLKNRFKSIYIHAIQTKNVGDN